MDSKVKKKMNKKSNKGLNIMLLMNKGKTSCILRMITSMGEGKFQKAISALKMFLSYLFGEFSEKKGCMKSLITKNGTQNSSSTLTEIIHQLKMML